MKYKHNKFLLRVIKILIVIVVTGLSFYLYLPKRNWTISDMNATVGENKIDVLCFGSSHMYDGLNPIQMYEDKGIAKQW